jgi:hypothetical protein
VKKIEGEPPVRIAIVLPSMNQVDFEFADSLARTCGALGATIVADGIADIELFWQNGTYVDQSRRELVAKAAPWGPTHFLWLDTDMTFPHTTVFRLLAHNKDIVGCNYTTRRFPPRPVTFKSLPDVAGQGQKEALYTTDESTGLEEAAAIGFGVVLMKTAVLEKVGPPGFLTTYTDGVAMGEDVYFCQRAREAGFTIWVDHDLSKEIGHVGRVVLRTDHAAAMREELLVQSVGLIKPGE